MKTVREICQHIGTLLRNCPVCVETGCMYVCSPGDEVHTTTNNILEFICAPTHGRLVSFDMDPEHIAFAKEFVKDINAEVIFVEGDSVTEMRKEHEPLREIEASFAPDDPDRITYRVDVLCLDSKEFDEDHMVNEYREMEQFLKYRHFVLVDDIHNPNSVKYKRMVLLLKEMGYDWVEVPTPTGMFVAAKGYPLDGFRR